MRDTVRTVLFALEVGGYEYAKGLLDETRAQAEPRMADRLHGAVNRVYAWQRAAFDEMVRDQSVDYSRASVITTTSWFAFYSSNRLDSAIWDMINVVHDEVLITEHHS